MLGDFIKIMFIDESIKQKGTGNTAFFVLCGLVVDTADLIDLEHNIIDIRKKYNLDNLKGLRKSDKETKISVSKDITDLYKNCNGRIISSCIGSRSLRDIEGSVIRYEKVLFFLIERFYLYLKANDDNGIVIFDTIDKETEKKVRKWFFKYISKEKVYTYGTVKGNLADRIYPSLFFADDNFSNILQTTDLIALSLNAGIWHAIKKSKESGGTWTIDDLHKYNEFLSIYWPLFHNNGNKRVNGYGIKWWS